MILGDSQIAPVHSLLLIESGRVTVEAIAHEPLLKVNDKVVRTATLENDDSLSIGGFQFRVRLNPEMIAQTLESYPDIPLDVEELLEREEKGLAELSAADLVERIEAEQTQIERYERQIETGKAALLQAALNRNTCRERLPVIPGSSAAARYKIHGSHATPAPMVPLPTGEDDQVVDEFERVRSELEDFSQDLEARLQRVNARENNIDAAARELAEAQMKLVGQLGLLLDQIATQPSKEEPRQIA